LNKRTVWIGTAIRSEFPATRRRTRRTAGFRLIRKAAWPRFSTAEASLGANAFVFGSEHGEYVGSFKTAWESLLLIANGHDTKRAKPGARVDRDKLRQIDLTGTTCVTRAPVGCWRTAWTFASSS
jgi:hypothetical protein